MITLKDIAQKANVSVMMVSRVVNKRYSEVSIENIEKIEAVIQQLGYIPNSTARSLSSKSSQIIAVIIQGKGNMLETPYNAIMLGSIIQAVQELDYEIMVHFIESYESINKHLRSWNAAGAIFLGTFDEDINKIQSDNKIPIVFTDSYSTYRKLINIGIDDYKGGVLAAEHFIKCGHKRLAFIGQTLGSSIVVQQRLKGYTDTIEKMGLSILSDYIIEASTPEILANHIISYKHPVSAIFVTADKIAVELIIELKKKGYSVPNDYSIIGFDNLYFSNISSPGLTTISQNIYQKAELAVDTLFQHINNPNFPTQNIVLDVSLTIRESVLTISE